MNKIPPAIDSAMWEVVESNDQQLMDEFAERYPGYKPELTKRVNMVRSLKGSRPKTEIKPKFVPVVMEPSPMAAPRWSTGVLLFAAASVAFATFVGVRLYDQLNRRPETVVVQNNAPAPQTNPNQATPEPNQNSQSTQPNPVNQPTIGDGTGEKPLKAEDPFQRRVTIKTERSSLMLVLGEIARQAGINLAPAPGMIDLEIQADYQNEPAISVLNDLGRNFGFTAMKEGDRDALLVPARDPNDTSANMDQGSLPRSSPIESNPSLSGPIDRNQKPGSLPPVGN